MTGQSDLAGRRLPSADVPVGRIGLGEERRQFVVKLIFCVYGLLIFEGVLRKWVLPQFGKPLFFIRDPFVLAIYWFALTGRQKLGKSPFLLGGMIFAGACFLVMLGHLAFESIIPAYLAIYGWRNYFFYLPLAFIMQTYLRKADLETLIRRTLFLTIPLAVLVVVQTSSPPFSVINAGSGDDPEESYSSRDFLLEGGIVRPSGTFTSNLGMTAFTASAVALNIAMWLLPGSRRIIARPLLLASTVATAVCLAVSGSRGVMLWSGEILAIAICGLLVTRGRMGIKAFAITAVLVIAGLATMPFAFPQATHAFVTRWTEANSAESQAYGKHGVFSRAVDEFVRFRILFDGTPLFGYGLGSAGNAAWHLGTRDLIIPFANADQVGAAETDWGRNVLELGPIVGCVLIAYRVCFTIVLLAQALGATKRSGNPLPWLLFGYVGLMFMQGEVTANGTINGYIWLFTGFCLAAISSAMKTESPKRQAASSSMELA